MKITIELEDDDAHALAALCRYLDYDQARDVAATAEEADRMCRALQIVGSALGEARGVAKPLPKASTGSPDAWPRPLSAR